MTHKEAMEVLKSDSCYECSYGTTNSAINCESDCVVKTATMIAIEALEKADKYRWHDLRKNTNDLPSDETICLVIDEFENLNLAYLSTHRQSDVWTGYKGLAIRQPVAWRYIEQFEVKE